MTKLGFGCAPILGRVGRQESIRALEVAYGEGINYFDIARSYGWGEAEFLLGDFLSKKSICRDNLEITTKFGLVPRNNKLIRVSKQVARMIVNKLPQTRSAMKTVAGKTTSPSINFTLTNAKSSLEQSLRALNTDYIDNILFHGYDFQNQSYEVFEILEFLEAQKELGKIRNYGFSIYQPLELASKFFKQNGINPDLIQMPCSLVDTSSPTIQEFESYKTRIIMHSPFKLEPGLRDLTTGNLSLSLGSVAGLRIESYQDLCELFLSFFCLIHSPYAIVASMFNPLHIRKNVETLNNMRFTKQQVENIMALLGICR